MLLTRKDSTAADAEPATEMKTETPTPGLFKSGAAAMPLRPAMPSSLPGATAGDAAGHGQKLIVGQGISLAGEITACDRLVVGKRCGWPVCS